MENGRKREMIQDKLKYSKLLFDGAFGTYYAQLYDTRELPEKANLLYPERVQRIHREYIAAGARIIRSNTFAANPFSLECTWEEAKENIKKGYRLAYSACEGTDAYVAADIGQIPVGSYSVQENLSETYTEICKVFLEEGAKLFLFETFSDLEEIKEAIEQIGNQAFVIVQFCVNQFGYSNLGLSARRLVQSAGENPYIDAIGLNCGIGPGHMQKIMRNIVFPVGKYVTALPNAGYPQIISNRMIFDNSNADYFAAKVNDIAADGADMVGGCCGTTPEYIQKIKKNLSFVPNRKKTAEVKVHAALEGNKNNAFFAGKEGKKLIAVELAPPLGSDDEKLMDAAHMLIKSGVDVLTFPDSPSGRTRADAILMAEKVFRETGICVMPHICCRDKNAIAMRSQLLGAHINRIHNFLVITGDPIPTMARSSVKSVFNFDAVGLMHIMKDMNEEQFAAEPICYGGAINQGRRNLEIEISRVKKKMEAGASFFLTQPVSTKESADRVRRIKEETGAKILCGIMPFVSLKNAVFMKNEMTGIDVSDEVLGRYREDMTREEGEQTGILLAREMMAYTESFADGYYFSFPFNRVGMLEEILKQE